MVKKKIYYFDIVQKSLFQEDENLMKLLIKEHRYARKKVNELVEAKEKILKGG